MSPRRRDLRAAARRRLGIERLLPEQREAVEAVVAGRDALVIMPTGSGKSAIYQLAGALIPGPTVVVSPLIALQRDQVDAIDDQRTGGAASIHSLLGAGDRREVLEDLRAEELEFLLLAPEQLENRHVLDRLRRSEPSLFVVDEAHCISQWGHDFRPAYLGMAPVIEALGRPTVLALTATAAPPVRRDILDRLGMRDAAVLVRGFDRPNIRLAVERFDDEDAKREALLERVVALEGSGIVYVATRRLTEELAAELRRRGAVAVAYHAGLTGGQRDGAQKAFMEDRADVVVATVAFGMGIDKPDVRFVLHHDPSGSVDAYYQEIGRAGRDGEDAHATLFYRPEDLGLRRFFSAGGRADRSELDRVLRWLRSDGPASREALRKRTGLSRSRVAAVLAALEGAGGLERLTRGRVTARRGTGPRSAVVSEALRAQERRLAFERSRVEMLRGYAETRGCRRAYLLTYFGEPFRPPCGACDNCRAGLVPDDGGKAEGFRMGTRVRHREWGEGTVQRHDDGKIVVLFDQVGYRTLAIDVVVDEGLLEETAAP